MIEIHIALATDDNYAIGCGVVIHSSLKKLNKNLRPIIHILYSDLSKHNRTRIERIARQHDSGLRWHFIDQKAIDSFGDLEIPRYYTKEAFFRLLLPRLLPNTNNILYLDVDLLIRADLSILFQNHTSSLVSACLDMYAPRAKQQIPNFERYNLKDDDLVVNTGVCMLNLKEIRKTALIDKSVQLLVDHRDDMYHVDQTAINIAFKGEIDFIPIEWNVFPQMIRGDWNSPLESIEPFAADILTDPKIVHFVGPSKPWSKGNNDSFSREWRINLYDSKWFQSEIELFAWVLKNRLNKKTFWRIWKWRSI